MNDDDDGRDPFAEFRCDHPREVMALLRSLRDGATPVSLSGPAGANLGATVWTVDSERQRLAFDVESRDSQLPGLVETNEATAVAYLDAVKLQFDLQDLVRFVFAITLILNNFELRVFYRFQRRSSYRVRTLERTGPTAYLRHPSLPDMQLALRVLDLSIGGCALLLPDDVPTLPLGITLRGVRLALDAGNPLDVTLRLQHASSILSGATGLRLGCELLQLDAGTERSLQRYIDQTQKRRRLLSLD